MESGAVPSRPVWRAVLVAAVLCLAALLAPWPAEAAAELPHLEGVELGTPCFANPRIGWVTALRLDPVDGAWHERFLLVTRDGGRTWSQTALMHIGQHTEYPYAVVASVGTQHLWTAHLDWPLQVSHDGGRTWRLLHLPWGSDWEEAPYDEHGASYIGYFHYVVASLSFVDVRHGWAALLHADEDHDWLVIVRTDDGGVTWEEQLRLGRYWSGSTVEFTNVREGVLSRNGDAALVTHDRCESWESK